MRRILTANWKYFLSALAVMFFFAGAQAQEAESTCDTSAQYLYWTGEVNNDFFNEKNWRITVERPALPGADPGIPSCLPASGYVYSICANVHDLANDRYPKERTLEPGVPIRFNLYIDSASVVANGLIKFSCPQKGITLIHSQLDVTSNIISNGVVSLLDESTVNLRTGVLAAQVTLNFLDKASWVYMHTENPDGLMQKLGNIHVDHIDGTIDQNFRINQYYQHGAVIRPMSASYGALKIFSQANQSGISAEVFENTIYRGSTIPGNMDKATRSFILKRGYMATFAVNTNGTGKSKVYIASETDMEVDALDAALQGNVRFVRVVPWNWVTKKGTGSYFASLDAGWFYNWNLNNSSKPNTEYVPMAWGASGALPAGIDQMIQNRKATHVLGFNESDNCNDQSGQFNNLCQPAVAVAYYENLMGTGLRLGTPAPRENGPTTWLLEFSRLAKERDVRFDFVAVHWYDWGSNPAGSPNADPQQIFNRFKSYLQNVHNIYKLPIWITEFNANPNRGNAIQDAFLRLALPYLDSLDYVERYAYFQPNPEYAQNIVEPANYFDEYGQITNIGILYRDHYSKPSVSGNTYACPNNLANLDIPYTPKAVNTVVFEAECGLYAGNQWSVLESENASNGLYIRGNAGLAGLTPIAKRIHFEFELEAKDSYRMWIRAASTGGPGSIRISVDGKAFEQITPFNSGGFTWFQVPRFYDLGVGKHRFSVEFPNINLLLDQVVFTNGIDDLESFKKDTGYCTPDEFKWGLQSTDIINFYEAESAGSGTGWRNATSANAQGGVYIASEDGLTSPDIPVEAEKIVTFTFDIEVADEYDIWSKIRATDPTATGLWIAVDDEPFRKWEGLTNAVYEWYWKKFHYSYPSEERSFSYFLKPGRHYVKVAVKSGKVMLDRLAVVTKGKLPESIDPNVLLLKERLEFEAEDAKLLGAAAVVNCVTSSNGKQVNLFNVNSNIVRFDSIIAETPGAYTLKISYMSAALRSFRIVVNGTVLGRQNPPVSGAWCFNGGSPGVFELGVVLTRGINVIDITPFSGDAPFIDKIRLEKADLAGFSFEAETAQLIGSNVLVNCGTASNSMLVNMVANTNNGIRFNNLLTEEAKKYLVDIHYITKTDRNMRISVNSQAFTTYSFAATGNWCFEGGTTKVTTMEMDLIQGSNTIEFRPTGSDAPFIDKIVIREVDPEVTMTAESRENSALSFANEANDTEMSGNVFEIYPNPVRSGGPLTLVRGSENYQGNAVLQITDLTGRVLFNQTIPKQSVSRITLPGTMSKGTYVVSLTEGKMKKVRKIVVY